MKYIKAVKGAMPRPISIPRTAYVHIGFAHPDPSKSAALYGPDESGTTVYAPFFTSTLRKARTMPLNDTASLYSSFYQEGRRDKYGYRSSAWWAFNIVANALNFNYQNMTEQFVKPAIELQQGKMLAILRSGDEAAAVEAQDSLIQVWWDLYEKLVVTYNDGTFNFAPNHNPKKPYEAFGYPKAYLESIAFDKDFWKSQSIEQVCDKRSARHEPGQNNLKTTRHFVWLERTLVLAAGVALGVATSKIFCKKGKGSKHEPLLQNI